MKRKYIKIMMIAVAAMLVLIGTVLMAQQDEIILDSSSALNKKTTRPAVPFPHARHMGAGLECKACHHMDGDTPGMPCASCHTPDAKLNLEQAFHKQCIGCNTKYQKEKKGTYPRYCGECHIKK